MKDKLKLKGIMIALGAVVALGVGGAAIAGAAGGFDDDERPITGDALTPASQAALEHTGGGRVTDTEVGDEEGYYEVEVTRDDGSETDVHLDRGFDVLGTEGDGAGGSED